MSPERNLYCERLGLSIPRLDDVAGQKGVKLFHLMVVALLERGRPMGLGDLAGRLRAAGVVAGSGDLALSLKKAWHGMEPIYRDAEGNFGLNLSSSALERILWTAGLRAPRFAAPAPSPVPSPPGDEMPLYVQRAREAHWAQIRAAREAALAQERRRQAREASALRRAVLRAVPDPEHPQALALLDVGAHSIRTFTGDAIAAVPDALSGFHLLVGLHIRETLHALRLDPDRWRLVDLRPPQKSRQINRAGRTLAITPELLIWGTTGVARPLGDPENVARYLARGEAGKLARRLESDVKALYAFYRYGVLHRGVRLRWGFLDEVLGVDWALPGDPHLHDILHRVRQAGAPVDIVVGSAPGWADPWSRARRVEVVNIRFIRQNRGDRKQGGKEDHPYP